MNRVLKNTMSSLQLSIITLGSKAVTLIKYVEADPILNNIKMIGKNNFLSAICQVNSHMNWTVCPHFANEETEA
jgi:hypothetical protein